jgi:HEAT repeat protein
VATPEAGKQEGPAPEAVAGGREAAAEGAPPPPPAEFEPIFDGKTLTGWSSPDMSYWSVTTDEEGDGAITARSTEEHPVKSNQFLAWQLGEVDDFELKLKYRIRGTKAANSGIQFRSRIAKEGHAIGYQADMDVANNWTGALYDERGRGVLARRGEQIVIAADGKKTTTPVGDAKALSANIKKDDWNEYHIAAWRDHLVLKINGKVTVDVVDRHEKDQDLSGALALQLHTGPPMAVQFKDIQLRKLSRRSELIAILNPDAALRVSGLIAVLKSDAPLKEKDAACRELARIGTRDAVPALAALLGDEKLSHMARYALEPIPDPAVDAALRRALGRLKGRRLVGVIGSVGVRRDAGAIRALGRLLRDGDAEVVQAAARALGAIGTPAAARALEVALPKAAQSNRLAFCEGLFRCAETLSAGDRRDRAGAIYDRLRGLPDAPHQLRAAALRGTVLTRGKEGLPLILQAIRGDDFGMVQAAARTAMELPGAAVTKALADEFGKLDADKQILLALTLGKRADAAALPALCAAALSGKETVRVAAIRALSEIGDAAAVPVLVGLLGDDQKDVRQAAQDGLAALAGPQVDAALMAMLDRPDAATRRLAVDMLGQRRVVAAFPALLKAAGDPDESVLVASIKVLGHLAGVAEFPALVGVLVKARSSAEIRAAEGSLSAVCIREARPSAGAVAIRKALYGDLPDGVTADVTKKVAAMLKAGTSTIEASNNNFGDPVQGVPKRLRVEYTADGTLETKTVAEGKTITITAGATPRACIDALCAALEKAPTEPKRALLRVLRSARGARALAVVRAAAGDADAKIRDEAVSLLCGWPAVDALPDVIRIARSATDLRIKVLALRGCFRLIPMQHAPAEEKLALLKEALALAERKEEKRLALAALAAVHTPEALSVVVSHLGVPGLKEEASLAVVAIGEEIVRSHPSEVADAVSRVLEVTANKGARERAEGLLKRAKKRAIR